MVRTAWTGDAARFVQSVDMSLGKRSGRVQKPDINSYAIAHSTQEIWSHLGEYPIDACEYRESTVSVL